MSTEAKEPGQRAHEAWHSAMGWHPSWSELTAETRSVWVAVEQACREAERAAVVKYLRANVVNTTATFVAVIEAGRHLEGSE